MPAMTRPRVVTGDLGAGFDPQSCADLRGNDPAHAAKPWMAILVHFRAGVNYINLVLLLIVPTCSLRYRDDKAPFGRMHVCLLHRFEKYLFTLFRDLEFGDQTQLGAAKDGRTGEPAGIAAHHLHHKDPGV